MLKFKQIEKKATTLMIPTNFLGGGMIAICISWSLNHSILWCLLHGIFGWLYIIYYVLVLR